jgi:hypothetical protein
MDGWILSKEFHFDDYHLPEDDNHHSHRRGNLKSYTDFILLTFVTFFELFLEMRLEVDIYSAKDYSFFKGWGRWGFDMKNTNIPSYNLSARQL